MNDLEIIIPIIDYKINIQLFEKKILINIQDREFNENYKLIH